MNAPPVDRGNITQGQILTLKIATASTMQVVHPIDRMRVMVDIATIYTTSMQNLKAVALPVWVKDQLTRRLGTERHREMRIGLNQHHNAR